MCQSVINDAIIILLNKKSKFLINYVNIFFNKKNNKMSAISVY